MDTFTRIALIVLALPLILTGCNNRSVEEKNREIIERYFNEAWNEGKVDALDELLTPDYINHTPSVPNPPRGPAGLKPILQAIRRGFPDLHYQIRDVIATRDKVVARVVMTGTHTDTLFNIPPTGRHIEVNQINIERIVNGRIAEHWRVTDELNMMQQLGVVALP
ncbi:ester cyclase [Dyadobacter sp. 676]|uniref:Ester cyclase n=1 Tax=Dyadobacter sp. 676 TaxID=3088362 RepID=A0AAU8FGA6_9BACT